MVEKSGIVCHGKLINENEWKEYVTSLQTTVGKQDKNALKAAIVNTVQKRMPKQKFGIFFSGGVDSSTIAFLCKKLGGDFVCFCVGFQEGNTKEPDDIVWAKEVAEQYQLTLVVKVLNLHEVEKIIQEAVRILGSDDPVTIGVASVVIAAFMLAEEKKIAIMFSGLGSEEIFAGYERHQKANNINEECWKGLAAMWQRDFLRDYTVGKALGIDLRTPFLDKDVIVEAMKFEGSRKISGGHKKLILREIAHELGLAEKFAFRKKQAAQYGSSFDGAIEKLAKKKGFRYKKEYLRSLINETLPGTTIHRRH